MPITVRQKKAINATENKVLVVASAGGAKTSVLTQRIINLIKSGVDTDKIVAITFTTLAAQEMKKRIGEKAKDMFIGTIHSYANKICLSNNIDTYDFIMTEQFDKILEKALTVSDLKYPKVEYLFIDEFQDTGELEEKFVSKIPADNIYLVGDSRQIIYGFKNGDTYIFERYYNDPAFTKYYLNEDFRNPKNILAYADSFLARDKQLGLNSVSKVKEKGLLRIGGGFRTLIEELFSPEVTNYKDWYVLCRTNAEVDEAIKILSENYIPNLTFKLGDFETTEQLQEQLEMNAVKVLTIHSSKGLTLPKVIVVGGQTFSLEERRISYVAATRASEELYWCKPLCNGRKKKKENKIEISDGFTVLDS